MAKASLLSEDEVAAVKAAAAILKKVHKKCKSIASGKSKVAQEDMYDELDALGVEFGFEQRCPTCTLHLT